MPRTLRVGFNSNDLQFNSVDWEGQFAEVFVVYSDGTTDHFRDVTVVSGQFELTSEKITLSDEGDQVKVVCYDDTEAVNEYLFGTNDVAIAEIFGANPLPGTPGAPTPTVFDDDPDGLVNDVSFGWTSSATATAYNVIITPVGGNPVVYGPYTQTTATIKNLDPDTYDSLIEAVNVAGSTLGTQVDQFIIAASFDTIEAVYGDGTMTYELDTSITLTDDWRLDFILRRGASDVGVCGGGTQFGADDLSITAQWVPSNIRLSIKLGFNADFQTNPIFVEDTAYDISIICTASTSLVVQVNGVTVETFDLSTATVPNPSVLLERFYQAGGLVTGSDSFVSDAVVTTNGGANVQSIPLNVDTSSVNGSWVGIGPDYSSVYRSDGPTDPWVQQSGNASHETPFPRNILAP